MSSTTYQPNFQVNTSTDARILGTEFDNMSEADLQRLINAAHQVKTGRPGNLSSAPPPVAKRVVNLEHILGGL